MVGFAADVRHWLFFVLTGLSLDLCMSALFRVREANPVFI
jgi:hypothetical protein